jgi:hypothetical protein
MLFAAVHESAIGTKCECRRVQDIPGAGGATDARRLWPDRRPCEGFRMPAALNGAANSGGRRTKTSKGDAMGQRRG